MMYRSKMRDLFIVLFGIYGPDMASHPVLAVDAVLVGIHCDPHAQGGPQFAGLDGITNWDQLVTIIDDHATPNGVRVTIQLAENWVRYVLEDTTRVATLQQWILDGHQVAFHHHDVKHDEQGLFEHCAVPPDQWSEVWTVSSETWEEKCLPTYDADLASDLLCILQARLRAGPIAVPVGDATDINLASHGTNADQRTAEWQPGAIYSAATTTGDNAPLTFPNNGSLARSSCEIYAGRIVPQGGSNPFVTVGDSNAGPSAVDVRDDISSGTWSSGDYVSVTFHPHEYELQADKQEIDALFVAIANNYGANELMSEVLDTQECISQLSGSVDSAVIQRTLLHSGDWCACTGGLANPSVPAVSAMGLVVVVLGVLVVGSAVIGRAGKNTIDSRLERLE